MVQDIHRHWVILHDDREHKDMNGKMMWMRKGREFEGLTIVNDKMAGS